LVIIETALSQFRASTFWESTSCEASIRTAVDLVLFDRMMLIHDQDAARNLLLVGEQHIEIKCLDGSSIISGTADYVLGYPYSDGEGLGLESMYIAIEAEKAATMSKAVNQLAAYLGMYILSKFRFVCLQPIGGIEAKLICCYISGHATTSESCK
jgi:hypothetical protein